VEITLSPIGVVHCPHPTPEGVPIQAAFSDTVGTLEVYDDYVEGLRDIDGFDYLILVYRFHLANNERLEVTPFLDNESRGVFATRAPTRPNRIGLSTVRLLARRGNVLDIGNVDMVSGTPVIDIKPYVPAFDSRPQCRIGWFDGKLDRAPSLRADDRMR